MTGQTLPRLPLPRVLLITPAGGMDAIREQALDRAMAGGVRHVLFRAPGLTPGRFMEQAMVLRSRVQSGGGVFLLHDRVDLALVLRADGVHLPEGGIPTCAARRLLGSGPLLGRSCHDVDGARLALDQGADYVTLSPVFATRSHPEAVPLGVARFAGMVARIPGPVLALGGVTPDNAASLRAAGAAGVAMIRGVLSRENPGAAARYLLQTWQDAGTA